jgi:VIT1/CCC1 family predicted Fe2+/Mn2+ transporter
VTTPPPPHTETHRNAGWLRAAVLGANDGLISTSSLLVGVASADATSEAVLIAGVAGVVAGMLSMAAGEYVSVSSQADTEEADLAREREELATQPRREKAELTAIYVQRGLTPELAGEVARQLMEHDALGAHARDELGLSERARARPLEAAAASGLAFFSGGLPPLLLAWGLPSERLVTVMVASTPLLLGALGATAAWLGRASILRGVVRVVFWGVLAMACSSAIGRLFGS